MSELADTVVLSPEEEASRLWEGALGALESAPEDLVALCEALDLGLRTVEILALVRLQPIRDRFPATIGLQLEQPVPEVDVYRDAVTEAKTLELAEILDLLSAEELECVGPRLHRGWEDRRFSCRRSRKTAEDALGFTLGGEERDQLLLLAAYRNRIFRVPPPVSIAPRDILAAVPSLRRLVERLQAKTAT